MESPLLIVDGHNALYGLEHFSKERERFPSKTRRELVDWLSRFQSISEYAVIVVFDGRQRQRAVEGGDEGEALVIYSREGESADAVIERLAMSQAKKRRVVVASDDRLIAHCVVDSGGEALRLVGLVELVDGELAKWRGDWGIKGSCR
ncbi:MAG: NYN domain-containing protein [Verrucomicrobiota bacterium]